MLAGCLAADSPSAAELYARGRKAEKSGHMAEAYLMYSEAAAMEPGNQTYWMRSQTVRSRAILESLQAHPAPQRKGAADEPAAEQKVLESFAPPTPQDLAAAREPLPPTELSARGGTKDFDLRGDARLLFENVSKAFGLDCVFDGEYEPGRPLRFQIKDVNYRDALHALELATGSFIVPLSDKLFLVSKDTPQKRADLEPNVSVSVYLNEANSQQDMTALLQVVQQTAGLQKISLDTNTHMVVLRGPLSKVLPARAIIEQLMTPRAQVAVEMRLLEVSRNNVITYGINFPTLLSLTPLTTFLNNQPTFANSIAGLLTFGGGKTLMGIGILNPSLVATLSDSLGRVLVDSDVRSVSGQPATLHAGQRYPVLQAGYFGPASFSGPGAYTPPPSFTYVDLGVTVKVTPMVQSMEDVLLDVDAEFMVLTGAAVNGIPVISNRLLKSKVALKFGQWAVIGGLLNTQDTRSITGLPGVSGIPGLGALTSTHDKNDSDDQVLVLMRPRLLTLPPSEMATQAYPLGSDTRPITPL